MTGQASIKRRVQAVILLASGIVLLVTAAAFVAYEAIDFRSALVRKLATLAAVIAENSAAPLAFNNKIVAEEILAALRAEPYIEAAVLFDDEGEIFATFPKELPPGVLPAFTPGKRYEFRDGALVLYEPVLQEGKPIGIQKFIGRRPIFAFGNSDGDHQMLQWTAAGSGVRFTGLVHHTDPDREWAYDRTSHIGKLDKALDEANAKGWTVVDMKRNWNRVFPFESIQ